MSKQIEDVMELVTDATCAGIDYGAAEAGVIARNCLTALHKAEAAVEAKLRELLPVWQPISTAPRDGTMILLGKEGSEDYAAISTPGFWQEGWDDSIDDMGCDSGFVDVEFQEFSSGRSFGTEKYRRDPVQPTRWMAMPKAPE